MKPIEVLYLSLSGISGIGLLASIITYELLTPVTLKHPENFKLYKFCFKILAVVFAVIGFLFFLLHFYVYTSI